jgi:hypothetical protein
MFYKLLCGTQSDTPLVRRPYWAGPPLLCGRQRPASHALTQACADRPQLAVHLPWRRAKNQAADGIARHADALYPVRLSISSVKAGLSTEQEHYWRAIASQDMQWLRAQ